MPFLGLSYSAEMLDYHKRPQHWFRLRDIRRANGVDGSEHDAHRSWQVNQPLFDGRRRWKKDLPAEMLPRFGSGQARALMEAFGYA